MLQSCRIASSSLLVVLSGSGIGICSAAEPLIHSTCLAFRQQATNKRFLTGSSWLHDSSHQASGPAKPKEDDQTAGVTSGEAAAALGLQGRIPAAAWPYAQLMRLDKPIGTWLLAFPGFWSIALAADPGHFPDVKLLALFGAGALLLRGAGCTINDLWDRDLDKQVERTRSRPLASGALQPMHAVAFLALQLSLGLSILLQLNQFSQIMGATSLLLVATYPLFKRFTYWPQAFLGLTINWGALMGYAAVRGYCDPAVVLPLYLGGVAWTLVYDTIYAHQDKKDDVHVGIKSTALLFGKDTKTWLMGFTAISAAGWVAAGAAAGCSWPHHVGVLAATSHMAWQIRTVNLDDGADCSAKFASNKWVGAILFAGSIAGHAIVSCDVVGVAPV